MVYAPAESIFAQGRQNVITVASMLFGVLGALFVVINLLLWRTVIRPLKTLTSTANVLSHYSPQESYVSHPFDQSDLNQNQSLRRLTGRQDEPGQLARAFYHMIEILSRREQDLQRAVQDRTQSLRQEMLDRQTAQEALQTYSHAMNHDLRNLVIGISNIMQSVFFRFSRSTVETDHDTATITMDYKALNMIQQSCDRQLQLMNSLMDVQSADIWKFGAGTLDTVNLPELAAEFNGFFYIQAISSYLLP
ncbi:MAG: hypothetical protein HC810_06050 [Acaryochloridaceae cyanobacterium RL_2_7]|nr:hypothetical protein [Acaryochloridaceae cyanobacterium RL_2_7]